MTRKCRSCGTPALDAESVFCNHCGARLPEEPVLTCRTCRTTFSDPQSRFCNRCGTPLTPAAQPAPRAVPAPAPVRVPVAQPAAPPAAIPAPVKETRCPRCGFMNPGENRIYCKKCGAYIREKGHFNQDELSADHKTAFKSDTIRIKPDGMDELRKRPVSGQPAAQKRSREPEPHRQPFRQPEQPVKTQLIRKPELQQPVYPPSRPPVMPQHVPEPVPQRPQYRPPEQPAKRSETREPEIRMPIPQPAKPQEPPHRSQEPIKKAGGPYRKVACAAAALLLVIAVIAVVLPQTHKDNTAGSAPQGVLESLPLGMFSNLSSILNLSVPVVNDTPLNVTLTES